MFIPKDRYGAFVRNVVERFRYNASNGSNTILANVFENNLKLSKHLIFSSLAHVHHMVPIPLMREMFKQIHGGNVVLSNENISKWKEFYNEICGKKQRYMVFSQESHEHFHKLYDVCVIAGSRYYKRKEEKMACLALKYGVMGWVNKITNEIDYVIDFRNELNSYINQ